MKQILILFILGVFVLSMLPVQDAEARRGFGSGFGRSSFGKSSFGFGRRSGFSRTSSRRSFWGRSSVRSKSSRRWSGGNVAQRVGTSGSVFTSRKQATSAYQKNLKTRWKSKPSSRPAYVPRRYSRAGRNYDVVFRNGNYGYWGPGRTWFALAAGSMLVNSTLMANRGYYYGTPQSRNSSGLSLFLWFLAGFLLLNFIGKRFRRFH
ncbi:MAG TPA: hypothetical protein ENI62_06395 [Gammaproteobacteria bacterium]|nr:hypothetical protein [Gammaproteobacteria bacterium]